MAFNFTASAWEDTVRKYVTLEYMEPTTWKPVPGFEEAYEVSSDGMVRAVPRSFIRSNGKTGTYQARTLKPRPRAGYLSVCLSFRGRRKDLNIHRLVCEAFHGPAPDGKPLVLHRNGLKHDNRVENLYWGDYSENLYDAVTHGTHFASSKTHCPQNHEYSLENTRITPQGHRVCRTCHRDKEAIRWRAKRGLLI